MTAGLDNIDPSKRRKRSEYSKKGCRECKRRKIKCDEKQPSCWQCERLKKQCTYPEVGEKVPRVSVKLLNELRTTEDGNASGVRVSPHDDGFKQKVYKSSFDVSSPHIGQRDVTPLPIHLQSDPASKFVSPPQGAFNQRYMSPMINTLLNSDPRPAIDAKPSQIPSHRGSFASPYVQPPVDHSSVNLMNTPHSSIASPPNNTYGADGLSRANSISTHNGDGMLFMNEGQQMFDQKDLDLLAVDLNNIVTDIIFQSNVDVRSEKNQIYNIQVSENKTVSNNDKGTEESPNAGRHKKSIMRDVPLDYIQIEKRHGKLYLEEFYNNFASIILPFNSYDDEHKYFNPVRDQLLACASHEPFLLAAIIAQGAKSSFIKNNVPEDQEAYCTYLSKCLTLLEPALGKINGKEGQNLKANIEAILLTVLLLTTANASNTKQNWRPHLRGAKDLILKITSGKKNEKNSKILTLCKYWFISIEVLAGLSSRKGGTLKSDEEIDLILTPGDSHEVKILKDLGLLLDNGFNLLGGYHNDCVVQLRDLIKILNVMRKKKNEYVPTDALEHVRLLSEFYKMSQIYFVTQQPVVPISEFKDGQIPDGKLLEVVERDHQKLVISWMDASHRAYVYASMITLFTRCFKIPYDTHQVQSLTKELLGLVPFLHKSSNNPYAVKWPLMIIQWPMLVAGMNCMEEDDRFVIMKFFRAVAQIGSGSAGFALKKINHIWSQHDSGSKDPDIDDDNGIDIVSY